MYELCICYIPADKYLVVPTPAFFLEGKVHELHVRE